MGQRANYIIKNGDSLTIHYNHWRANQIASDLYLGDKKFIEFVNECQLNDEIIEEPWIEGCVIIDIEKKELFFWSFEFSTATSVIDYYLKQLSKKWVGWKLQILDNRMYDVEQVLGIDYISKQKMPLPDTVSKEEIEADNEVKEWFQTLVIIKKGESLFITKSGNINMENLICYGQEVIPLLEKKLKYSLPKENEDIYECIIIDIEKRQVFINESVFGLSEACKKMWPDYDLILGDFGYVKILKLAGINISEIELSEEEIKDQFSQMVQINDTFDPFQFAERISQEHNDIKFNPDFFDNVKPKKSIVEKIKSRVLKLFKQ